MSTEGYDRYFHILELTPDASFTEIRQKYEHLRSFYSGAFIELSAINDDFTQERKADVLREIEEAFAKLSESFESKKDSSVFMIRPSVLFNEDLKKYLEEVSVFSGPVLKQIRQMLQVEFGAMVQFTKIRKQYFIDIEEERFSSFSAEVYLKGYLTEYARFLSLDPVKVVDDYLARYRSWKKETEIMKTGIKDTLCDT